MNRRNTSTPRVEWDGTKWLVHLPVQDGKVLKAEWKPGLTYVVRIREVGTEAWGYGFETPLTHFSFIDLKPDTEYEMQVCTRNAAGDSEPQCIRVRTNPAGRADNIIPFPKR